MLWSNNYSTEWRVYNIYTGNLNNNNSTKEGGGKEDILKQSL